MKLSHSIIMWTPQGEPGHPGFAGKINFFVKGTRPEELPPHRFATEFEDPRQHHDSLAVRGAFAREIARLMVERDGLDPRMVHKFFVDHIDEYRAAVSPVPTVGDKL